MSQHEWKHVCKTNCEQWIYGVEENGFFPLARRGFAQVARFKTPILNVEGDTAYDGWVYHYYPKPWWIPVPQEIVNQGLDAMKDFATSMWRLEL